MPTLPTQLPRVQLADDLLEVPLVPIAVTIPEAVRIAGIGRTLLYEEMSTGRIEAVKCGLRTLVLLESLRAYIARLPRFSSRQGSGS